MIERLLEEQRSGVADHRKNLFPLLVLETWARLHLDREPSLTPPA